MKNKDEDVLREEFEKEYPINYGNPFPHFIETPVATHIIQWWLTKISQARLEELERVKEICEGMKQRDADNEMSEKLLSKRAGYNLALSDLLSKLEEPQ